VFETLVNSQSAEEIFEAATAFHRLSEAICAFECWGWPVAPRLWPLIFYIDAIVLLLGESSRSQPTDPADL